MGSETAGSAVRFFERILEKMEECVLLTCKPAVEYYSGRHQSWRFWITPEMLKANPTAHLELLNRVPKTSTVQIHPPANTLEEAVQLAVEVREVHSKAGFEIRNWHSNAQQILERVGAENSQETFQTTKSFTAEKSTMAERGLGMLWEPNQDLNELNAGVIGVRLMRSVLENHSLEITKRYFHTDSTVLLAWLRADPRKYRPYVQFRTTEILAETSVEEWRWVPTRLNIADEATKWGSGPSFDVQSKWYSGPDFLWKPECEWPVKKPIVGEPTDELRRMNVHQDMTKDTVIHFNKFSRWEDVVKSLAYLYHFVNRCSAKQRVPTKSRITMLTHQDYVSAEQGLWRIVQAQAFEEEIAALKNVKSPTKTGRLVKSSPLAKLSAFLDEQGLLRMESRIDPKAAYYPYNFRNPIILPKCHRVTELLILRFHAKYGHANTETVVNELRQLYYIAKVRSVVKRVIKECMWCRIYKAKPQAPRMAPLPQPRVMPYVRPFTHTGIDYFGPLLVKQGRSSVKRWVAMFTCLTIRAVHLEVVHSLTIQSCKMAIRRFVDKRGAPQNFFSDNGTFTNAETEWHFNPPSAPHMGGVWERKVRSIKDALKVLACHDKLDDEGLLTLLAEASMIFPVDEL
ncbi:uncharacterized protein LOC134286873 [Aedes albopictus]|uniref:Integrase zinc-binding domain-containing protein n=1 Tax=Aedes albopictus TaxID=7160 RepID=A0ABM1YAG2_AEDAL